MMSVQGNFKRRYRIRDGQRRVARVEAALDALLDALAVDLVARARGEDGGNGVDAVSGESTRLSSLIGRSKLLVESYLRGAVHVFAHLLSTHRTHNARM